jgi:tetratricopeptide (TPR) repeat protein
MIQENMEATHMTTRVSTQLSMAAVFLAAGLAAGPAQALDTIIGGMASACAREAKAGIATRDAINNCTDALLSDVMSLRDRGATMVNRGTMYMNRKEWDAALLDFDMAIKLQPRMGEAYVNRGATLVGMQRFAEGEQQITHGLTMDPELPERAYYNRALARWRQDNIRGAYNDFRKAQELKPDWNDPVEQRSYFTVTKVATPGG